MDPGMLVIYSSDGARPLLMEAVVFRGLMAGFAEEDILAPVDMHNLCSVDRAVAAAGPLDNRFALVRL